MQGVKEDLVTEYGTAILVLQEMSWSWRDLCEAPERLVEEIIVRASARMRWEAERNRRDESRRKADQSKVKARR